MAVHEGYHALDDLESVELREMVLLETEVKAWKGQAAFVTDQLAKAENLEVQLKQFVTEATSVGQLGVAALTLAAAITKPTRERDLLVDALAQKVEGLDDFGELLKTPEENLPWNSQSRLLGHCRQKHQDEWNR